MTHRMKHASLLLLAALLATTATSAADRIGWLAARDPAVLDSFRQHWRQQRGSEPELLDHSGDTLLTVRDYADYAAEQPRQGRATADHSDSPVVLLAVPQQAAPASARQAGIYAEPPASALLALWQSLLPDRQPAGLLVGADNRPRWRYWRQLASQQKLTVKPGFIRAGEQAQRVFNLLRPGIGVLLYSAELATDDPIALTVILRESLSSGLPVFGTDPALLPAGALAVLHQPAPARGQQAAALALALLRGNTPGWQPPQGLATLINHQVARTLQLPLADLPAADTPNAEPANVDGSAPDATKDTEEQP